MPRPPIYLDDHRDEITHRTLALKETQPEIISWLSTIGIKVETQTLKRRLKVWGVTRRASSKSTDQELIEAVRELSHSRRPDGAGRGPGTKRHNYNDETIAKMLCERGLSTTRNQVKEIRLRENWRRRERRRGDHEGEMEESTLPNGIGGGQEFGGGGDHGHAVAVGAAPSGMAMQPLPRSHDAQQDFLQHLCPPCANIVQMLLESGSYQIVKKGVLSEPRSAQRVAT